MNILDVYKRYNILPMLQQHQLRVAGVAYTICTAQQLPETKEVVTACLLHDMGNILKFDMVHFLDAFEPEGVEYWAAEKARMQQIYGTDEHAATVAIAKELGVSGLTLSIVDNIGFSHIPDLLEADNLPSMIGEYADMRVAPHGVVSLEERLEEARKRYATKIKQTNPEWHAKLMASVPALEARIFKGISVRPEDITAASVAPLLETLRAWEL